MPLAASGLGRVLLLKQRLKTIMQGDVPKLDSAGKAVLFSALLLLPLRPNLVEATFLSLGASASTPSSSVAQDRPTMSSDVNLEPDFQPTEPVEYALAGAAYGTYELIATTGYDVALRDVVSQKTTSLKEFKISCAAFAPVTSANEGQQFAAGCQNGQVLVFDCTKGEVVQELGDFEQPIHSIVYSPSGQHLLIGGEDGLLVSIELGTNVTKKLPLSMASIRCVRFSPSGDRVVVTEETTWRDKPTGRVEVLRFADWQRLWSIQCPQAIGVAEFRGNSDDIVTADWDGTLRVWEGDRQVRSEQHPKEVVSAAAFSANAFSLSEMISEDQP